MSATNSDQVTKKQKTQANVVNIPSSITVHFTNQENSRVGPPVDIPVDSNTKQLEMLINSLLSNDEKFPYAFYINDIEIEDVLRDSLRSLLESTPQLFETTLNISFQPLSVFRVRPVTRCAETMSGHTDAVLHVSYSPDGKRLASGGGDMAVRFWNVITSMPMFTCIGHRHHVLCTAWAPNGERFVSADRSGEIRVWNPKLGQPCGQPLVGHSKWITSIAFEPYHLDSRCQRMATSSKDHTIKIWNIGTGRCETTISGHTDSVECVKWGGSGLLYSCSRDRTIKVWAVDGHGRSQQKLVRTLTGHAHRINSLALNCDHVLRTGPYQLGHNIMKKKPFGATVTKQNNHERIDSEQANEAAEPDEDNPTEEEHSLVSLDREKMDEARMRYEALIGADGERLASCSDDFTLFIWQPQQSKTPLLRMTGHQQLVNHIAFSPDGRFLASASFDKKVKLWCGKTGRFLNTLNGHVGAVYQVSWSPDSCFLLSASKDSTVKLWAIKDTKKAFATLPGHEDEVYTVDWSPNSSSAASGSKDRTIKIWNH